MFIIDAHLDLSMNAMEWNRDLTQPVPVLREREKGLTDRPDRTKGTVSLPELREGNIGLVVATQIARYVGPGNPLPGWHSPEQAWAQTQGQLAWYKAMEAAGEMVMIRDAAALERHLALWSPAVSSATAVPVELASPPVMPTTTISPIALAATVLSAKTALPIEPAHNQPAGQSIPPPAKKPIGYILSLEGADSMVTPQYLERAYEYGLRAVGPAHYGPGRYANGTDAEGALHPEGRTLLREMERLNIILDVTHLCDDAFWEAMDLFGGPVWASHNNCRALVNHNRQFSDEMIKALIEKGAVIGGALDAWMMVPGWVRGVSTPEGMKCNLDKMIDHLDHICQLAGNTLHVGMGTDLDGAFGKEQSPCDLDTIADLQNVPALLANRGYSPADIENIMHGNWLRFLRKAWKE